MKIGSLVTLFALFCSPLFAMWDHVPTEELLKHTDIVVVATLYSVSERTENNIDYSDGLLVVRRIVAGRARTYDENFLQVGDAIEIKWQNSSMIVCPRVEFSQFEGRSGIWLLNIEEDGTVRADYPGRRIEEHELSALLKLINRRKFQRSKPKVVNLIQGGGVEPETKEPASPMVSFAVNSDEGRVNGDFDRYSLLRGILAFGFFLALYPLLYRQRLIAILRKLWPT